jgi:ribosome-binding factor A
MRRAADGPSQRQLRVGEELRHALAAVFERGELRDPALAVPITVTEVRVSPDLRQALVFVMPLGGIGGEEVIAALIRARGFLRKRIAAAVQLRSAPNLTFRIDVSFDRASHINELLHSPGVARDLLGEPPEQAPAGADEDGKDDEQ